ncbi:MAG: class I adenylate-forming enzyme family protein [Hyphomicrobiales bacterium]|nr:class I adenylate-forming enzyme family protein [Hyphomicrobiales bacterium]
MNIAALVSRHADSQPEHPAIEGGGASFSYVALDVAARRLAGRLSRAGVGVGDLVGLRLRDTPDHLVALLAIARIGAIALPMDWRGAAPEIGRIVERFQPKLLLVDDAKPLPVAIAAIGVNDLAATEPVGIRPASLVDSPLVYGLTSGTTGTPKGIVTTHEEMFGRFVAFTIGRLIDRHDRFLLPLPLVFDAGRAISFALLTLGATIRLFPTLFDPQELADEVNGTGATALIVTPKTSRALLGLTAGKSHLMPGLRAYVSTAGKLQPEERAALRATVAPCVIDYYGTTGGGPVALITGDEEDTSPTAAGRLVTGIEVEVVDETGALVGQGISGRIRMRGPGVTRSFAGETAAGDETIRDGWYYPGDTGHFTDNGILHLTGRAADLIKRGGLMIHAQEVEYVLSLHDSVVEAAVVGIPAATGDEEVVAFIVANGPFDAPSILRHCRQNLAGYKVPRKVVQVDAMPRNTSGKVVKAELRKLAEG